jgi:O-antigen/teichoic acid export membrane protein
MAEAAREVTLRASEHPPARGGLTRQIFNQLGVAVASKLVPIAAIFIYSRLMSVADYGVLNLFQSYLWIFALALSLNLHVAVGRYIYLPGATLDSFLGTTLLSVGAVFALGAGLLSVFADGTAAALGLPAVTLPLMLAAVAGQIAESLLTQLLIYDQRSDLLLRVVAGKAVLSLALGVALLLAWDSDKFLAVLVADAAASFGLTAVVLALLQQRIAWAWRREHVTYMVRYALPLVPYMLGLTLLSQFDRILIDRFHGKEATGLYSLGYNVGVLLLMVVTAVLNAFNPSFFAALNRGDYARVFRDSRTLFSVALIATIALVLLGPDAAALVLPTGYAEGFALVPTVALGGLCFVVFQVWVRVLAFAHRTGTISAITVGSALLNIGLNLWLLPAHGWQVAAWTTVAAYIAMSVGCVTAINAVEVMPRLRPWREVAWIAAVAALVLLPVRHDLPLAARIAVLVVVGWAVRGDILRLLRRDER